MKINKILQLIEYKITGGSAYSIPNFKKVFNSNKEFRKIDYHDDDKEFGKRDYDGDILIDGELVIRITLSIPSKDGYFRWTHKKYDKKFKELAKLNHYDDNIAYDSVRYIEITYLNEILEKIISMIKSGTCNYNITEDIKISENFYNNIKIKAEEYGITPEEWLSKEIISNKNNYKI